MGSLDSTCHLLVSNFLVRHIAVNPFSPLCSSKSPPIGGSRYKTKNGGKLPNHYLDIIIYDEEMDQLKHIPFAQACIACLSKPADRLLAPRASSACTRGAATSRQRRWQRPAHSACVTR